MNCEFCNNSFCSKSNLIHHQWNAIYCIQKRNEEIKSLRILVQKQQEIIELNKGKLLEKEITILSTRILVQKQQEIIELNKGKLLEKEITILSLEEPILEDNNLESLFTK